MLKRIITGLLLAALFVVMLYYGGIVQVAVFTISSIWAVHEMAMLFRRKELKPFTAPAYAFALTLGAWLYFFPSLNWMLLWSLCVFAIMVELIFNKQRAMKDSFASFLLFVYPLPFISILLQIGISLGACALMLVFICPLFGDIAGMLIGIAFGKHPLCPDISPKKTVEGSVAMLFGSVLGGLFVYLMQNVFGGVMLSSVVPFLIIGAFCGFIGQIGDLFASCLKRWAQIKDFSSILPGHGGLMDRIDSVLLCAPIVYFGFYMAMGLWGV